MRIKNLKLLLIGYTLIIGFIILLNVNKSYNIFIAPGYGEIPSHWRSDYTKLNEFKYIEIIKKLDIKDILSSTGGDLESTSYLGMSKKVLNISYGILFLWTIGFILHLDYKNKK